MTLGDDERALREQIEAVEREIAELEAERARLAEGRAREERGARQLASQLARASPELFFGGALAILALFFVIYRYVPRLDDSEARMWFGRVTEAPSGSAAAPPVDAPCTAFVGERDEHGDARVAFVCAGRVLFDGEAACSDEGVCRAGAAMNLDPRGGRARVGSGRRATQLSIEPPRAEAR